MQSSLKRRRPKASVQSDDEQERAEASEAAKTPDDEIKKTVPAALTLTRATSVRNMAIWRMLFFSIMIFHECGNRAVLTPFVATSTRSDNHSSTASPGLQIQVDMARQMSGKDRWFAYQHLHWLQDLHVWIGTKLPRWFQQHEKASECHVLGFFAAFGKELRIPGWRWYTLAFTILYTIQFLAKTTNFTNHNYLFILLMLLTILSGGGHISGTVTSNKSRSKIWCDAATIAMRAQFAILYGFASLWKLHPDWFAGRCVQCIFTSFESMGQARGIPWSTLQQEYFPHIYVFLAWSGLLLDSSMFLVLTFTRPSPQTRKVFLLFTLLFHVFTTIAMGQVIGHSFPATCMAGIVLFLPLTLTVARHPTQQQDSKEALSLSSYYYDKSLVEWIQTFRQNVWKSTELSSKDKDHSSRDELQENQDSDSNKLRSVDDHDGFSPCNVADSDRDDSNHKNASDNVTEDALRNSKWPQALVLIFLAWQVLFPLRMIIASSRNFPRNRLGYRFSWTMMLHTATSGIIRTHKGGQPNTVLLLSYLSPTCFSNSKKQYNRDQQQQQPDLYMPRSAYMPSAEHPMADSRTIPLHVLLGKREEAMLATFPIHLLAPISAGFNRIALEMVGPDVCHVQIPHTQLGVHAVHFIQLNGHGPYSRLVDPTVDLVHVQTQLNALPYWHKVWNALWDSRAPYEYALQGVGSLKDKAVSHQERLQQEYAARFANGNTSDVVVSMITDRAACLQRRPLWFRPMTNPYCIVPVQLPTATGLGIRVAVPPVGNNPSEMEEHVVWPDQELFTQTIALEIGLVAAGSSSSISSMDSPVTDELCGETKQEDVLIAIIYVLD